MPAVAVASTNVAVTAELWAIPGEAEPISAIKTHAYAVLIVITDWIIATFIAQAKSIISAIHVPERAARQESPSYNTGLSNPGELWVSRDNARQKIPARRRNQ